MGLYYWGLLLAYGEPRLFERLNKLLLYRLSHFTPRRVSGGLSHFAPPEGIRIGSFVSQAAITCGCSFLLQLLLHTQRKSLDRARFAPFLWPRKERQAIYYWLLYYYYYYYRVLGNISYNNIAYYIAYYVAYYNKIQKNGAGNSWCHCSAISHHEPSAIISHHVGDNILEISMWCVVHRTSIYCGPEGWQERHAAG